MENVNLWWIQSEELGEGEHKGRVCAREPLGRKLLERRLPPGAPCGPRALRLQPVTFPMVDPPQSRRREREGLDQGSTGVLVCLDPEKSLGHGRKGPPSVALSLARLRCSGKKGAPTSHRPTAARDLAPSSGGGDLACAKRGVTRGTHTHPRSRQAY